MPSRPVLMDRSSNLPLARACLADDQHRGRRSRRQANLFEHPPMGRPEADQIFETPAASRADA